MNRCLNMIARGIMDVVMAEINSNKILITGATGKIGGAILKRLAGPGRKIVIHYNLARERASSLSREAEAKGAIVQAIPMDLAAISSAMRLISSSVQWMGGLNLLIHAASIFEKMPFERVTEDLWDKTLSTDLKAAFFIAQRAAEEMKDAGGKMIFFSDIAAKRPYLGYLPYSIAKAGIEALVVGLARALAPKVQVNAIAPYLVTSSDSMGDDEWARLVAKSTDGSVVGLEEIASLVERLIKSPESATGQIIEVGGRRAY